jgi:L-iditol 2-dehydrogenase
LKAVILGGGGGTAPRASVSDLPRPSPGRGELVVEMRACGLCGTDLEKLRGQYTASMAVLGHEAVGVVAEAGEGQAEFRAGDRVFPHHHVPCGECYFCKAGSGTMCDRYRSSNIDPGGFSEYFRVPAWNLEKGGVLALPDSLGFEAGALIEPVACCLRAIHRSGVVPGGFVFVVGAGPVGLAHAMALRSMGSQVAVSDVSERRLSFAGGLGIQAALDARRGSVAEEVKKLTGGRGADLAMVASGSPRAIVQALGSVRKGGRVCLFGIPPRGSVLDYDVSDAYNSELSVISSYGATEVETREALEMMTKGGVDFTPLVTHRFPLDRFDEALGVAANGEGMKVLLVP